MKGNAQFWWYSGLEGELGKRNVNSVKIGDIWRMYIGAGWRIDWV